MQENSTEFDCNALEPEAAQRLLLPIARLILESPEADAGLSRAVFELLGGPLRADMLLHYGLRGEQLRLLWGVGVPAEFEDEAENLALGEPLGGAAAATREPLRVDPARVASDTTLGFLRRLKVRASACHPLLCRDGAVLGTFAVASTRRGSFTVAEVQLLQTVSHMLSLAWERRQVEDALRAANQRKGELLATQAFLLELTDVLQPLADPVEIESTAAHVLGTHLGASRVAYGEVNEDGEHLTIHRDFVATGQPSLAGRYRMADFGVSLLAAMNAGCTLAVSDVSQAADLRPEERVAYAHLGIAALAGVPLRKEGRLVANLSVHFAAPRMFNGTELSLIEETGRRTWDAVQRARAERALRTSEARFRALADTVPALIWRTDSEGGNAFANQSYLEFSGLRPEEMRGAGWARLLHSDMARDVVDAFLAAVRDQQPYHGRSRLRRRDGAWRWVDNYANPIFSADGTFLGHVGVSIDVTGEIDAQELLREEAGRQAFLVQLTDALRRLTDPAEVKDTSCRLLGGLLHASRVGYLARQGDEVAVQASYADGVPPLPPRLRFLDFGAGLLASQRGSESIVLSDAASDPRLSAEERQRLAALQVTAVVVASYHKNDQPLASFVVESATPRAWTPEEIRLIQEAAEHTFSAVERAQAEAALREADRRKDEFLATLAHELRNPLSPLRNGLHIARLVLGKGHRLSDTMAMMERQLGHLVRLVDDLLDLGRISAGKLELRCRPVQLGEILSSSVEASRGLLEARRHHLDLAISDEPVLVYGDFDRLAQVVTNLLTNAAKYTEPGGRIRLSLRQEGAQALIQVEDSGIGIAPQDLPRIFHLFSQVRRRQEGVGDGLGIGLSLVRKLVERHGGTVEAESAGLGQGSTFTVRLPLIADGPIATAAPEGSVLAVTEPGGRRVLVVDDNVDAAESLAVLLGVLGHPTEVVHTGTAALEAARRFQPEVVFLDIGLPGVDGFEVARQLRAEPVTAGAVLVALTGWGSEEDKRRSRAAGFDFHITKPADPADVQHILARQG